MAIAQLISRTQVNTLPNIAINGRVFSGQPHTWYTCPTGKKAIVKGRTSCLQQGAATTMQLRAAGEDIAQWVVSSCVTDNTNPFFLCIGRYHDWEIELEAGDIIQTTQNSGDNAEFLMMANALELPV